MTSQLAALLTTARPAQWMKNVVVLAPLVFAQRLTDGGDVLRAVAMFAIFCALASGVYFINDAIDAERDRRNPHKARRPVAAGRLSRAAAVVIGGVLAALAVGLSALLGTGGVVVLASYFALNVAYSLWLTRVAFVDGMAVAGGFVLRAIAGAVAISVPFSGWLILCTFLLTLLISLGKRRAELTQADARARGPAANLERRAAGGCRRRDRPGGRDGGRLLCDLQPGAGNGGAVRRSGARLHGAVRAVWHHAVHAAH